MRIPIIITIHINVFVMETVYFQLSVRVSIEMLTTNLWHTI